MICIDYQVFMFCASKVDGVENEESMWKHSPKNWGMQVLPFLWENSQRSPKNI